MRCAMKKQTEQKNIYLKSMNRGTKMPIQTSSLFNVHINGDATLTHERTHTLICGQLVAHMRYARGRQMCALRFRWSGSLVIGSI